MLKRLFVFGLLLMFTAGARANILVSLDGDPTSDGSGGFKWVYDVHLQPDELMRAEDKGGDKSFFTVYDFKGLVHASWVPDAGVADRTWVTTTQNDGITPLFANPLDDTTIANVTVTLHAGDNIVPLGAVVNLGQLTLTGRVGDKSPINFSSQALEKSKISRDFLVGDTSGPSAVPEPATISLMGFGLLAVGALALRRRAR